MVKHTQLLDKIGAYFGIVGALLIALNLPISGWAFPIFLVSSVTLAYLFFLEKRRDLMMLQLVFSAVNVLGIVRWLG